MRRFNNDSWGDSAKIFTRDYVTRGNDCRFASQNIFIVVIGQVVKHLSMLSVWEITWTNYPNNIFNSGHKSNKLNLSIPCNASKFHSCVTANSKLLTSARIWGGMVKMVYMYEMMQHSLDPLTGHATNVGGRFCSLLKPPHSDHNGPWQKPQ